MCVAGIATAPSSARPTSSTALGRRVTNVTQRWLTVRALAHAGAAQEPVRLGEPRAGEAEQRGEQADRDRDRDHDGAGGREAHHGQERDADDGQAGEGDDDGGAGEHDGAAGGAGGLRDGLTDVHPAGEVLLVAGEDEQRVVDADGEAEHRGQDRGGLGQVDHARERGQARHADADAERGGQQRHAGGEQRGERDRQHQERDHHAHRLGAVVGLLGGDAAGELDLQAGLLAGRAEVGELLLAPRRRSRPRARGRRRRRSRSCRPCSCVSLETPLTSARPEASFNVASTAAWLAASLSVSPSGAAKTTRA